MGYFVSLSLSFLFCNLLYFDVGSPRFLTTIQQSLILELSWLLVQEQSLIQVIVALLSFGIKYPMLLINLHSISKVIENTLSVVQ